MLARVVLACGNMVLMTAITLGAHLTPCWLPNLEGLTASDAPNGYGFGWGVALRDGLAVAGAPGDSRGGDELGAAYLYRFSGDNWQPEARITPDLASSGGFFGQAAALAGPLLIVGEPFADVAAHNAGAVYVFRQEGEAWVQVQRITAPDARADAAFGLVIAATAEHVVIAAPRDDTGGDCAGAVYLYRVQDGELVFERGVRGPAGTLQYFGSALAMEGARLVIGAMSETETTRYGAAHVLEYDGVQWAETAILTASDAQGGMLFGAAVATQGDLIVVGANHDHLAIPCSWYGSAYVFRRTGSEWVQEAKFIHPGAVDEVFGSALALAGGEILVGAPSSLGGQVYVFQHIGSEWVQQQAVPTPIAGHQFGIAMAVDNDTALIGCPDSLKGGRFGGAAYTYRSVSGSWSQEQEFLPAGPVAYAALASAVTIDAFTAVMGAPLDDGAGLDAGAAYVYAFDRRYWVADAKLVAPDAEPDDQFGTAVVLGPGFIVVGAPREDEAGEDAGAAYTYVHNGTAWEFETKLLPPGDALGASFGTALALCADRLVVGAPGFDQGRGTAYVFLRGPTGWTLEGQLPMSGAQPSDQFGHSVDISGNLAVVGAPFAPFFGAGRALAFRRDGGVWVFDGDLEPTTELQPGACFGWAVSISGDLAVVGAPYAWGSGSAFGFQRTGDGAWLCVSEFDGPTNSRFGSGVDNNETFIAVGAELEWWAPGNYGLVHVYMEQADGWSEAGTLNGASKWQDYFGHVVALGGGRAIVGAPGNDDYGLDSGMAQIYGEISDCNQNQQLDLCEIDSGFERDLNEDGIMDRCEGVACRFEEAQEFQPQEYTGETAVSLSGDVAVVGVGIPAGSPPGAVYVYRSNGSAWNQEARLQAWDAIPFDGFGSAVAVRGDRLLVGAPNRREIYSSDGIAYLFRYDGTSWVPEERFATPYYGDRLGASVALGDDVLALGGPSADMYAYHDGAVYVYRYVGGAWVPEAEIARPDALDYDSLGQTLALDGNVLVTGTPSSRVGGVVNFGAAHVYRYDGLQWEYEARLTAPYPRYQECFGASVAVADDLIVVGTSPNFPGFTGCAYVFRFVEGAWMLEATLVPGDAAEYDHCGKSVATDGHLILVGVPGRLEYPDYGYMAVFVYHDGSWIEAARLMASDSRRNDNMGTASALDGGRALVSSAPTNLDEELVCTAYLYYGVADCNGNGQLDFCELRDGTAEDADGDWILDVCEARGDVNCDGAVNVFDIDPFVLALTAPVEYQEAFPNCSLDNADANGDGAVNVFDIDPFVVLLTGGGR